MSVNVLSQYVLADPRTYVWVVSLFGVFVDETARVDGCHLAGAVQCLNFLEWTGRVGVATIFGKEQRNAVVAVHLGETRPSRTYKGVGVAPRVAVEGEEV